ncbi:hypothetical protein Tsp_02547 [Trichinella spiralis]|uniref:Uncharacterized protein n=1 Tax=Trichinella spiralis TaxID=6334 RepID=E5S0Y5_TRISP|nr:hypothetical protein Tsp_02547 [Trichinella spiralis]KRY43298.1 hypothetical protein T01_9149 [Trichinella spiralis]
MPTSGYDEFAAMAVQSGPKWRISDSTTELPITSCSATISGLVYSMCLAIFINPFSTFIPLFQILNVSTVISPSSANFACDRPYAGWTFTRQLLNNQNRQDHSAQHSVLKLTVSYGCC